MNSQFLSNLKSKDELFDEFVSSILGYEWTQQDVLTKTDFLVLGEKVGLRAADKSIVRKW